MSEPQAAIIEQLKDDFADAFTYDRKNDGNSTQLMPISEWRGKTRGVKAIKVYLCGTDSLTGSSIRKHMVTFTSTTTRPAEPLRYYYDGPFHLECDAVLENGTELQAFYASDMIPMKSKRNMPRIEFQTRNAGEWTQMTICANCWARCAGKLWVKTEGRFQKLPDLSCPQETFMLPTARGGLELLTSDKDLPVPTIIKA